MRTDPRLLHRLAVIARAIGAGLLSLCLYTAPVGANESMTELDGMLEPDMMIDLASPVPGVVEAVHVDRADIVTRDQVVAELQDSVQQAQLRVAQTRAQLSGEIRAREASKVFAERRHARTDQLWEKRVIPLDDRDEAEARARVAAEDVNAAREKRKIVTVELSLAEEEVEQRVIRSPIDGVVVDRFVQPGNRVDEQALIRIARIDPLRVEVVVPYDYFDSIKTGMQAEIKPELPVEGEFIATVTRVDRVIDAASGTFTIRLSLPNPDGRLPSGLKCKVVFPQGLAKVYQREDAYSNIAVAPSQPASESTTDPESANPAAVPPATTTEAPASAGAGPDDHTAPLSDVGSATIAPPASAAPMPEPEQKDDGFSDGWTTIKTVLGYAIGELRDNIERKRAESEARASVPIESLSASRRQAMEKRQELRAARHYGE